MASPTTTTTTTQPDNAQTPTPPPPPTLTWTDTLLDSGILPHFLIRRGIRQQLSQRATSIASTTLSEAYARKQSFITALRTRPIAIHTATANEQHYEVGTSVLRGMLGPRMKYSCCLYPTGKEGLGQAEVAMLEDYVSKIGGGLEEGMEVLDLGCGWGSVTLYLAERFPKCRVTGFSNSRTQREWIVGEAERKGLSNVQVVTGDVVDYEFEQGKYDRVVSVELFEHMKNYELLMAKVARALKQGGKLFVHIFAHRDTPYDFEDGWMTTHFFTGGTMPSADLLLWFQGELKVEKVWWVNGMHYAKTCEDWLAKMLKEEKSVREGLRETYGEEGAKVWWNRWQVFYLACAELFAWEGGDTWGVGHYLFEKK